MSDTNDVCVDSFVEACTKLQGDAKRSDVQAVHLELDQFSKRSRRFMKICEERMDVIEAVEQDLRALRGALDPRATLGLRSAAARPLLWGIAPRRAACRRVRRRR